MAENIRLKTQGKDLLRERSQGDDKKLAICNGCKGFYSRRRISKHKKTCEESRGIHTGSLSVNFLGQVVTCEQFQKWVLEKFRDDETGRLCQKDFLIVQLGRKLWAKSVRKDRRVIMNDMRTLGNLILEIRKVAHDDSLEGRDVVKRDNFEFLTKAIQNMTQHEDTGALKPGLKLAIGFLLKKIANVLKGTYIQENNLKEAEEIDRFSSLLDLNWEFIFYSAQLECEQRRQNLRKPRDMPLEKDLTAFRNFIRDETKRLTDTFHKFDRHDFIEMRNLLVSRLTLFNARRGGEPARMLISEWKEAEYKTWIDNQLLGGVTDPLEKELIRDMELAYQSGKGSRRLVPVLFPKYTVDAIQKLIDEREDCGVSCENPFLFPNTGLSNDHVIGWNCIQSVAKEMGDSLEQPNLLTADKFRHRASTLFALLEMPAEKRETFYRHMGHSEQINRDVYQCPLALRELTEVGSFLDRLDKQTGQNAVGETETENRIQMERVEYFEQQEEVSQESNVIENDEVETNI